MTQQASPQPPAPSALRWALAGSVMVMIAAGGLFYYASQLAASKRQAHKDEITVTIHPHSCEPNALSVPAGPASFRIVNHSDRAVEWEILDGVLVVEERENIAPGLSQVINARLQPGDYAITCGLLSNPRGTLHVTPTAESDAQAKARPSMVAFVGPLSEFRVYLSSQGTALIKAVSALEQAIQAGDLAQAQALYLPARAAYQRLAPAAQRLGELDNSINARADYFEKREQDPGFVGFHRLEYTLFQQRDLSGLAPIAQRLLSDVTRLKQQLLAQSLPPEQLVSQVARSQRSIAEVRASSGEEERYSHSDLNGFAANLETTRKVVDLLRPLLAKPAAPLLAQIDSALGALDSQYRALHGAEGYASYDSVGADQRKRIADQAKVLADALDGIDPALGLWGL
ncbi:iron uptake system protein EfeO [Pseudomonas chlororaphis]|uniref:iron uptake system protein EfeO n=1 Tax=Pseudomonas chlororaphis TaxID=587753 RepID=UPI000F56A279|nr:iron uptake system protein EfeO [Pseudomonas chlororaphis]AZC51028.1 Ferrous iron transport periplasmic protein EfeO, peptidase-M75 domain [Pseudomonas chlororaphis subsp. piscium]AZC57607.1 Ferrous iron transport periplasmic protein EfeO, peptidase-M75 domain [Pseudomonas chlororaphis subsp. piscium]AZC70058.1 Ferrous iron transport periplasmic protein EfeO, peptidase-M75 domain [Pseudomonas chlororaphis subsp. piscium]AZC76322.1 Ferrous iron transport periplasmic protein EfeO, peptidase-M7